jgi:hypothetical protein
LASQGNALCSAKCIWLLWESHGFNIREDTMLRRLIPLTFVLAGASAALADDMKIAD